MKKFLLVLTGLLLFSTQTNAACYVGMPIADYSYGGDGVLTATNGRVCATCSGNTCTQ